MENKLLQNIKPIRLYGNISNLEKTGYNSTYTYYKLTLFFRIDGELYGLSAESGFSGYTKKEIYNHLKNIIIGRLYKHYGVIAK